MILPNKVIKPIDSLFSIGAFILNILKDNEHTIDDLVHNLNNSYPKKLTIEKVLLSLDFLYATGKIQLNNNKVKIL